MVYHRCRVKKIYFRKLISFARLFPTTTGGVQSQQQRDYYFCFKNFECSDLHLSVYYIYYKITFSINIYSCDHVIIEHNILNYICNSCIHNFNNHNNLQKPFDEMIFHVPLRIIDACLAATHNIIIIIDDRYNNIVLLCRAKANNCFTI